MTSQRHTDFNGTVQFGRMSELTMSNIQKQAKAGVLSRVDCKNGLKMGNSYMKNAVGCNGAAVSLNYILLYVNLEINYRHNTRLSLYNAEYTIRKRCTRLAQLFFYKHVRNVTI